MNPTRAVGRPAWAVEALVRPLAVPGWAERSRWGYDPVLECYWAELWRSGDQDAPSVRIGPDHLITTMTGLARALAVALEVRSEDTFLALTA